MKLIVITDLDGALLDESYSFAPALPALEVLRTNRVPCILCSSKTRSEIEYYRTRLGNTEPFITENGGAIYIPNGYFDKTVAPPGYPLLTSDRYTIVRFGERYEVLRKEVKRLRARGFSLKGFGDMTVREVSRLTGLSPEEAKLAKQREFDEPFIFVGGETELSFFANTVHRDGFSCLEGGLFRHLVGHHDKGKAASTLVDLYRRQFGEIMTTGLGDGPNDIPMLQIVDYPVVIPRPNGLIDPRVRSCSFIKADMPGPMGWNRAVLRIVTRLGM